MHHGQCETCSFQRVVTTTRGARFSLCRRSGDDPRYPRYPKVPVVDCPGYLARRSDQARKDG